jgi:hypothetical protein
MERSWFSEEEFPEGSGRVVGAIGISGGSGEEK